MRILYGVQGTGNGHITRALAMAKAFQHEPSAQVDFLVSGRPQAALFGLEPLGDYQWRAGLTFATRAGKVSILDTVSQNPWWQFWQDVHDLDLSAYDLVVTDFEPITAWAAKRQKVPCIGLGRQYAFWHGDRALPVNPLQRAMVRQFAPCDLALGTHWYPLSSTTLPPLIEPLSSSASNTVAQQQLVYLPFEPLEAIYTVLENIEHQSFDVFHPDARPSQRGHVRFHKPCRTAFREVFNRAEGVITNAGFGTTSEAMAAGKRLLVKPLKGQFEQQANAHCLQQRNLASVCHDLSTAQVKSWLTKEAAVAMQWPDITKPLCRWLAQGANTPIEEVTAPLWSFGGLHTGVHTNGQRRRA